MKTPLKTQLYYTIDGIPHYDEFKEAVPNNDNYEKLNNQYYKGPLNLFELLLADNKYKFCRDDGPALHYNTGYKIYAFNCKLTTTSGLKYSNWPKITNHILCKYCDDFCNQKCF